jgi:tRNA A37 threonylcarbamoyltransferase TsaD
MIHKAQLGVPKEQIVRGLCRAVVANYLSNVAKGKKIRQRIVFQGGVAANEGVREAFREALGEEITVPEHFAIMGAIGAAIIAKEMNIKETKFIGFQSEEMNFKSQVTECFGCDNNCEIVILQNKAGIIDYFGSRCGSPSL